MKLELLTWLQVQQIDLSTPVIIPTGALEQHGPHLPLYTDTLFVEAIANAVELELSNEVLLTPVLWVGGSENLMDFSGTITATPSSYISNLQAIIRSLSKHGFYKFCVLNSHGGNTDLNSVALRELKAENKNLVLTHFAYWELLTDVLAKVQEGPVKKATHAGEFETSLMLYLYPEYVNMDLAKHDGLTTQPEIFRLVSHFDETTEDGYVGYAELATAEKGKIIFEESVKACLEQVRALQQGFVFVK